MKPANDNNVPPVVITALPSHGSHAQPPEPKKEWRVRIDEHDSWSGPDVFYRFFPSLEEAQEYKNTKLKEQEEDYKKNRGMAPEYYTKVREINEVIRDGSEIFVGAVVG